MNADNVMYEKLLNEALLNLSTLEDTLQSSNIFFEQIVNQTEDTLPSNLDVWDILFAAIFGATGAFVTTNEQLSSLCRKVHDIASEPLGNSPTKIEKIIDTLLGHSGDIMDKVPTTEVGSKGKPIKSYLTRKTAKKVGGLFSGSKSKLPHRIMWGHDIFSFGIDNPFRLMVEQYGFGRGILQALKHLCADTFSRQGLPIPGHSFFDYISNESAASDTKDVGNRLYDIAKKMAQEFSQNTQGCSFNLDAFNEMFSIHIQDIGSQGLVSVFAIAYFKARNISNKIRKVQFRLLAYSFNFYLSAVCGAIQHGGVPHINWVALSMVIKNFVQLYVVSNKETKLLQKATEDIIRNNLALEKEVLSTGENISSHLYLWDYMDEYDREKAEPSSLIDFFEEAN